MRVSVLAVLAGELSAREAARRYAVTDTTIHAWKQRFLEGGRQALLVGSPSSEHAVKARERQLEAEVEELKAALGEAHVELRVWRTHAASPRGARPYLASKTSS